MARALLHELLLAVVGLLFVFLVPGFLLTYALFPRKGEMDREYDLVYRLGLGVVLSIAVVVLLGFGLNAVPPDPWGMGAVTAPSLWAGTLALSALFLFLGWYRGAHPWLARVHPALARPTPRDPQALLEEFEIDKTAAAKFRALAEERDRLRTQIRSVDRKLKAVAGDMREHYRRRRAALLEKLQAVDVEMRRLEEARAKELY